MQCGQIRLLIPAYVKNELNVLEKSEVKHHFSQCPVCSSRMLALQAATQNRSGERTEKAKVHSVKIVTEPLFPKVIDQPSHEQLELTVPNGSNNEKEMDAEEVMEENLERKSDAEQLKQAEPENKREMVENKNGKPGFRPQKARRGEHSAEQKLKDAGILVPYPAHMTGSSASLAALRKREQKIKETTLLKKEQNSEHQASTELSGEALLRMRMLAMLAEETAKLQLQGEVNRLPLARMEPAVSLAQPEKIPAESEVTDSSEDDNSTAEHFNWMDEPDDSWRMISESGMETIEEMQRKAEEIHETDQTELISTLRWQDDPAQYVEIPYIHPVTRLSVLRKIRRNSPEGILFLEEAEEKRKAEEAVLREEEKRKFEVKEEERRRQAEAEQAALLLQESGRAVKQGTGEADTAVNSAKASAQTARLRLMAQMEKESGYSNTAVDKKQGTINKTAKLLPFSENPRRQAAFFRFLCLILLLVALLFAYGWWKGVTSPPAAASFFDEVKIAALQTDEIEPGSRITFTRAEWIL